MRLQRHPVIRPGIERLMVTGRDGRTRSVEFLDGVTPPVDEGTARALLDNKVARILLDTPTRRRFR